MCQYVVVGASLRSPAFEYAPRKQLKEIVRHKNKARQDNSRLISFMGFLSVFSSQIWYFSPLPQLVLEWHFLISGPDGFLPPEVGPEPMTSERDRKNKCVCLVLLQEKARRTPATRISGLVWAFSTGIVSTFRTYPPIFGIFLFNGKLLISLTVICKIVRTITIVL